MRRPPLWKISILTTSEAEDAVSELLAERVGAPASSYTDVETGTTTVAAYLSQKPFPFWQMREGLQKSLDRLRGFGVAIGPGTISLDNIPTRDWAEAWKRHFTPIQVGRTLLIRPSWSHKRRRPGQRSLILDPGLSFGTGHHPTTLFCLRQIVARAHRKPSLSQAFLDLGTGSGILALAAARVGYAPVKAIDNDPDSIRIARANARRNRLEHRIQFRTADLARLPQRSARQYSLICANLVAPLLIEHRDRVIAGLAPSGRLVLAGILETEASPIRAAYEAAGLEEVAAKTEGEWRSLAFAWALR